MRESEQRANVLKLYIIVPIIIFCILVIINCWPDKFSNIVYERKTHKYDGLTFSVYANVNNHNLSSVRLHLVFESKNDIYDIGEILKFDTKPPVSWFSNGENYHDHFYKNADSFSVSETAYELETSYSFSMPSSSKPIIYLDENKTNKLPIIDYEFVIKLCKQDGECEKYNIQGKLNYKRNVRTEYYSPMEFISEVFDKFATLPLIYIIMICYIIGLIFLRNRYAHTLREENKSNKGDTGR